MSELYINLPQLKKVPAELSGIPQDIRRKIQSLDSIEQYVKGQISGGGELQRQIQSIREELERIANSMGSYGDALQQICVVYESCEEGIVKCGLSGYANAKNSLGEDVPWYKTDTFKWVVGAAVVVGTVVAAAVVLTVAAPAILTAVVVGAAIGAATGAIAGGIIGGYTSVKSGGTFEEGAADGFFWGSIGGAVSGAVAGVATATGAGLISMSAAQGIVNAGMYTAETTYDGGQVSAAGVALSFTTGAVVSAGSVVLAGKASQALGKLSGVLKNGSRQTVSAAESAVDGAENAIKTSYAKSTLSELKNAENFTDSSIEHIFEGQVNGRGKAVGYHYEGIEGTAGKTITGSELPANELGVYKAQVEVNGVPKTANGGFSSFFSKNMSPQEVVDAINEAYSNHVLKTGNEYYGYSSNGMKITMYLNKEGKIISAFPER